MNYLCPISSYIENLSIINKTYCRSYISIPNSDYSKSRIDKDYLHSVLDISVPGYITYSSSDSVRHI